MKIHSIPLFCVGCTMCLLVAATAAAQSKVDGYPVANFALTANAAANGNFFGKILHNPGKLGEWLTDRGAPEFYIENTTTRHTFSKFKLKSVKRLFPFVKNSYSNSEITHAAINAEIFCPLAVNDISTSSLPVLMVELSVKNPSTKLTQFNIVIAPDSTATKFADGMKHFNTNNKFSGCNSKNFAIACNSFSEYKNGELSIPINVAAHAEHIVKIVISYYDKDWISANDFSNAQEVAEYAQSAWNTLRSKTEQFDACIPRSGDDEIDNYLRWYMTAGIALTKINKNSQALTMGYRELNQRDSYWTTWLHLALFKDIEKTMLAESAAAQQPSGKIPTTILPLIERHDDLDINAFFILRTARYYEYYHDRSHLKAIWAVAKNAMEWLIARDCNGNGLPCQVSFWGDWKDVQGVQGRRYSPFSGMVYLAALKKMSMLATELADYVACQKYDAAYKKGYDFINKSTAAGGLWNGTYYCQIWHDGSINEHLLQDQSVGIFFGVVDSVRAASIFDALNKNSMTKYGIAETTPYYDAAWGYAPATYHNGAVWPWLSFMDCWARLRMGRRDEAIMLIKRVAMADLVDSDDWSPNEHINSITGENLGFILQGWNAALFGVVMEMSDTK